MRRAFGANRRVPVDLDVLVAWLWLAWPAGVLVYVVVQVVG